MPPSYEACELHEIINCSICHKPASRPLPVPDSPPFSAKYDGFCRKCRESIDVGERVVYRSTPEWEGVIHADCA